MPKLKQGTIMPTDADDLSINEGIAADPNTYELSEVEFFKLRPVGRPLAAVTKDRITIRLSQEVTDYFRGTGKGWQSKVDKILLDYVVAHK